MDSKFRTASKRAELWLGIPRLVGDFGSKGKVDPLFQTLILSIEDYNEHAPIIRSALDDLRRVSDGPVKWGPDRGSRAVFKNDGFVLNVWSSAHEAACEILGLILEFLVNPLDGVTDPKKQKALAKKLLAERWQALSITDEEMADLQERIRRELAKLLLKGNGSPTFAEAPPERQRIADHVSVDMERETVTIYDKTYPCQGQRTALFVVSALIKCDGVPTNASTLHKHEAELLNDGTLVRPDKCLPKLPRQVRAIIKSKRPTGYWIELPPRSAE